MDYPDDEDYEIISKKDVAKLKDEIKQLREGGAPSESTVLSRLNQMLDMFKDASASMGEEGSSSSKLDEISSKMDKILDQHQQLAEGILAIVDMIKEAQGESEPAPKVEPQKPAPQPVQPQQNFGLPPTPNFNIPPPPMPIQMQGPMPPRGPNLESPIPFPKPEMPSFNPMEEPNNPGGLPPLSGKPSKRGILGF